ncbi:MAG: 50S ribosomal protein L15 [Phycisphaerales bacterium]|nr:50S ribosomal protein L15 [Phycisphaerales bacterium]
MMIHDVTAKVGKHKLRMRVGRGEGSGKGGTSGRGHNGAKSRAGWTSRPGYQGGSTPLLRRFPKRGFKNADFRVDYHVVNVADLAHHFGAGSTVDVEALIRVGIVRDSKLPLKVLGNGDIAVTLKVTADRFSAQAKSKIEAAGGTATLTAYAAKMAAAAAAEAEAEATKIANAAKRAPKAKASAEPSTEDKK